MRLKSRSARVGARGSRCESCHRQHFHSNNSRLERSDLGFMSPMTRSVTGVCFQFFHTWGCSVKSSTIVLHAVRRGALPRTSTIPGRKAWLRACNPQLPEHYRILGPLSRFPGGETSITPDKVCSSRCKSESGVHFLYTLFNRCCPG